VPFARAMATTRRRHEIQLYMCATCLGAPYAQKHHPDATLPPCFVEKARHKTIDSRALMEKRKRIAPMASHRHILQQKVSTRV